MATIAIKRPLFPSVAIATPFKYYNKYALASLVLASIFVLYFFIPHGGVLSPILGLSVVFILFVPALALVMSAIAVRQIMQSHDRGIMLSYIALGITSLYFMVALAIPVVLVGLYILYSFVL